MPGDLKIGAVFPTSEIGDDPVVIRDFVQAVEGLGFDALVTYDHVLGAPHEGRTPRLTGPYTEEHAFHEPFVLFGYLAAVTRKIRLVTGVIVLPQRQTALVAKQAAEVALLSGDRLVLGVGVGWNHVEYEALGVPFERRGVRLGRQVELLRKLWREPIVEHRDELHVIDRAGLNPRPRRDIPIWFGSIAPRSLARAARLGDGVLFPMAGKMAQPLNEQLDAALAAAGRAGVPFARGEIVDVSLGRDALVAEAELWRAAGGTELVVSTLARATPGSLVPASGRNVDRHLAELRAAAAALL